MGSELESQSVNLMALYQLIKKLGQTLIINVFPFVKSTRGIRLRLRSSPKKSQKTQATFSKGRSPETKIMLWESFHLEQSSRSSTVKLLVEEDSMVVAGGAWALVGNGNNFFYHHY